MSSAPSKWTVGRILIVTVSLIGIVLLFFDAMYAVSVNGLSFYSFRNILIAGAITIGIMVAVVVWFALTD